jgi:hypothetical protein
MGEKFLVGKPEGRRPLGRPRRRWVDNITMDLGEVGWGDVDWNSLAQDKNRWVAKNAGKLSSGLTTGGFMSSAELHRVSWLSHLSTFKYYHYSHNRHDTAGQTALATSQTV